MSQSNYLFTWKYGCTLGVYDTICVLLFYFHMYTSICIDLSVFSLPLLLLLLLFVVYLYSTRRTSHHWIHFINVIYHYYYHWIKIKVNAWRCKVGPTCSAKLRTSVSGSQYGKRFWKARGSTPGHTRYALATLSPLLFSETPHPQFKASKWQQRTMCSFTHSYKTNTWKYYLPKYHRQLLTYHTFLFLSPEANPFLLNSDLYTL